MLSYSSRFVYVLIACFLSVTYATAQDTLNVAHVIASSKPSTSISATPLRAMDKCEFQKLGYDNVYEAVRNFAGATIKDYGGIGGIKTVSIRSLGAQHTSISYDGLSISDMQSGQTDISRFSLDNVEMISLSIGQSDNIFQPARLCSGAGVLEIRTTKPYFENKGTNVNISMKFASFKTYNPTLLLEQRLGNKWSINLIGDYLNSEGTYPFVIKNGTGAEKLERKNSDVERVRGELNLFGDLGNAGSLSVKSNFLYSERGLPGAVILYNPTANERLWDRSFFSSTSYESLKGKKWEFKGNLKYSYAWNRYIDISEQYPGGMIDDRYTQMEYYGNVSAQFRASDRLTFAASEDLFYTTLDSNTPECCFPERTSFLSSFAGQYRAERLTFTASILGTFIRESVKIGTPAESQNHLSPAASLSFKLLADKNFRIRASYKDGFRVPSFNDLYYQRTGNRNLKPERAHQYNLGLTWSEGFTVSIDGYYNHIKDKIATIPTMFIWKTFNIGEVDIWGFDVSASGDIWLGKGQRLELSGNYSFQKASEVIPYAPENSGSATLSWINPWVNISYLLSAVGVRYALPETIERNAIEGYLDNSVSLNHDFIFKKVNISLRGEVMNISNKNYAVIKYYPMPGRNYRLTVKFTY